MFINGNNTGKYVRAYVAGNQHIIRGQLVTFDGLEDVVRLARPGSVVKGIAGDTYSPHELIVPVIGLPAITVYYGRQLHTSFFDHRRKYRLLEKVYVRHDGLLTNEEGNPKSFAGLVTTPSYITGMRDDGSEGTYMLGVDFEINCIVPSTGVALVNDSEYSSPWEVL